MLGKIKPRLKSIEEKMGKRIPFNPNLISLISFFFAIVSCYFLYLRLLLPASLAILLSGFFDWLDGMVARQQGRVTLAGELLDAFLDKYGEALILLSFCFVGVSPLLCSLAIIGVIMTSYVQARVGEAIGKKKCFSGFGFERSDRFIYLALTCALSHFFSPLLLPLFSLFAIALNLTALLRFFKGLRML